LTIFKDGKETEKVTLSDFDDTAKLHRLFEQKGFVKYSSEEMEARRKMKEAMKENKRTTLADAATGGGRNLRGALKQRMNTKSDAQLSPKLRKQQMKEKLKQLKEARENYMVVGAPRG